jgi:5-hydroxyisourate hydrolase
MTQTTKNDRLHHQVPGHKRVVQFAPGHYTSGMGGISTHVLDTAKGLPAQGVRVVLELRSSEGGWVEMGSGVTDENGRVSRLLGNGAVLRAACYRLTFSTGEYFKPQECFYPQVTVLFDVRDPSTHHHIPLLLSPYGYTTYRGS